MQKAPKLYSRIKLSKIMIHMMKLSTVKRGVERIRQIVLKKNTQLRYLYFMVSTISVAKINCLFHVESNIIRSLSYFVFGFQQVNNIMFYYQAHPVAWPHEKLLRVFVFLNETQTGVLLSIFNELFYVLKNTVHFGEG